MARSFRHSVNESLDTRLVHLLVGLLLQLMVNSLQGDQFLVCPLLDHDSVPNDQNDVAVGDGRQAVRDGKTSPSRTSSLQRSLDHTLALGIQGTGGLVEQQQRRITNQSTANSNTLLLTPRELGSPWAHLSVQALAAVLVQEAQVGHLLASLQVLVGDGLTIREAIENIGADGRVEEDWLLTHKPKLAAPPTDVHVLQRRATRANEHSALHRVVEALEQGHHGALPTARRPYKTHRHA
mmetsp:Transcript_35791/g.57672  ORF Transcript_35791/g.57672 Transcript_35791/m.57672 type:complete len:238 (-) Transcript_35791:3257-3970(-)